MLACGRARRNGAVELLTGVRPSALSRQSKTAPASPGRAPGHRGRSAGARSLCRIRVKGTIPASKQRARWVAFQGRRSSSGYWDTDRCSSDGRRWIQGPSGKYGSYSNIPVDAIGRCSAKAPAGSAVSKAIAVA
jgi:hypothetical protein